MSELEFHIDDWLGSALDDPLERETLASLRVTAGANGSILTEVEDTLARTVRSHINVPAYFVARWLLVNWWRLRWEPEPYTVGRSYDWLCSHSWAGIGGDYAWPPLTIASDGEFVHLQMQAERRADVSAIRFLSDVAVSIPAVEFEQAVDRFIDKVEARLLACLPAERELSELREELREERSAPKLARMCKFQAIAGIDPGAASEGWILAVEELVARAGPSAAEEVLAVLPDLQGGLEAASSAIAAMRDSKTTIKLGWAGCDLSSLPRNELPWQRGARLASQLRARLGLQPGPVPSDKLEDLLDTKLPLPRSSWSGPRKLTGGYRNGAQDRTAILVTSNWDTTQRFYLARLIAAALLSPSNQPVLPVAETFTAFQKYQRSFAQEFLCPWQDLDAFTDENGTDEDGIADAANHFAVSSWLVETTLVNKGKLPRSRLPA